MIINISDTWAKSAEIHNEYLNERIDSAVLYYKSRTTLPVAKGLAQFLEENRQLITSNTAIDLRPVITNYNAVFFDATEKTAADEEMTELFNYDHFIRKSTNPLSWTAQRLCEQAKYKWCPYCQIQDIYTNEEFNNSTKEFRHDLDHYFDKSRYPYLSLSLSNLVPACNRCNSRFKGSADCYLRPLLNPMIDNEEITFSLRPRAGSSVLREEIISARRTEDEFELFVDCPSQNAKSSSERFLISEFYGHHEIRHEAVRVIRDVNNYGRIQSRSRALDFDVAAEEALPFNHQNLDYKNHRTGKMKLDVYRQYIATAKTQLIP